ncbi:hypothetical protein CK203_101964 [Vitis vinifera]|uniref:Uncharacterized protein n=1 Tax=Vitis vinifera TaxID=29760 RepID=A0A438BYD1_VITVI|nr:hypothetical protein CK203_101964 [Vitis vinifera]
MPLRRLKGHLCSSIIIEGALIAPLPPRPPPQQTPPGYQVDLHCAYHQRASHDINSCTALRHAIQDLIDHGLVDLGPPGVTTNPLLTHDTRGVPPPREGPFRLTPDRTPRQPLVPLGYLQHAPPMTHFLLFPEGYGPTRRDVQIFTWSGRVALPPPIDRPFVGAATREELQRKNDKILRQLHTTQARISIWSLLASSSMHKDALVRALSQIKIDTSIP